MAHGKPEAFRTGGGKAAEKAPRVANPDTTIALKRTFVLYTLLEVYLLTTSQLRKAAKEVAATGRKAQGERTRKAILEAAVHIASAEGLEGLTIGRLALELSMSKSGLFAHFGS